MIRKSILILFLVVFSPGWIVAQKGVSTGDLFRRDGDNMGQLIINQDPAIDSLLNRYTLKSKKVYNEKNYYGMEGWRIQIYFSSNRNAREESNKTRAEFISEFPDIASYQLYSEPGYFIIRVGDFRTKTEATKTYLAVSKVFPGAYIVPDIIQFPELTRK